VNPPLTTAEGRRELLRQYRDGLLQDTAAFWFPRAVDTECGGFLHCFDRDGTLVDSDKSVWAQGRMTWMLATLHNTVEKRPEWLEWARHGIDFLTRFGHDADGRMFFHLCRDGRPLRKRRYAYSECFAAIAHAAMAQATGSAAHAEKAAALFDQFVTWNFTPGLMPAKFTGARPLIGLAPRMMTLVTAQDLRDNLGASGTLTAWSDRCIEEIRTLFMKPGHRAVMESVAPDGSVVDHFDGRLLNPGHAIECAWFLLREARWRRDSSLVRMGCDIIEWMWQRGWDEECGGLFYFRDLHGHPVQEYWHDMKFWWPHDEAIIATLFAWLLTGEEKFAVWHGQVHEWAHRHFGDPEFGEWFGYLHRDGRRSNTLKGSLWKSFFHHPRMQWLCAKLLEEFDRAPESFRF
jgi:N-acylglucosamine 2-epimerase